MKLTHCLLLLCFCISFAFPQTHSIKKIIFIPHPRSDDQVHQSVQEEIAQINFSYYDMILLGGDLTYYTTIDYPTMDYCDSLFDLGSPNTMWTLGNHDVSHLEYISEYTHRPTYYTYYTQDMTFMVLNTELDANGFVSSYISGDQLAMIQSVADTITDSKYLILLQHRLLWMIGNEDLAGRLDSVGESTRQLDTSNFYQEVYPLLQQVKIKGIQVLCLGGDRANINIEYSPEDSITYLASTMAPVYSDTINHVLILTIDELTDSISWEFIGLADIEKYSVDTIPDYIDNQLSSYDIGIRFNPINNEITIVNTNDKLRDIGISIYDLAGKRLFSEEGINEKSVVVHWNKKGYYLIRIDAGSDTFTRQLYFR
jgi:hypothetical protein